MGYIVVKNKKQVCISCGMESPNRKDKCPRCGCHSYRKLPNGDIEMHFKRDYPIGARRRFQEDD